MMLPDYIQNIEDKSNTTIFVGVSGGVDSSVSAALLHEAGFDVTGVFIKVWQPDFLDCDWKAERESAMRACAQIGIPFKMLDLETEYKRDVVDYMIDEYKRGHTPNPDVMCNAHVKFGAFYQWAREQGADYVATGHYAQTRKEKVESRKGKVQLITSTDEHKDQAYFLWQLSQEVLAHTLFPVGHLEKTQVRKVAEKYGLITADKPDSQGLCFLGHVDMQDFLSRFVETEPGAILNEAGDVIGEHPGALFFTIGQRRGFRVTKKQPDDGPRYVVSKSMNDNTITVSQNNEKSGPLYNAKSLTLTNTKWNQGHIEDGSYEARIRYNAPLHECQLTTGDDESVKVIFNSSPKAVAEGQSCVIYDKDTCLGGGIIAKIHPNNDMLK